MRSAEAMDILRALTKDGLEANFPLDALSETIRRDWPASFAHILPAPERLIGQRSTTGARDIHVRGLEETICNQLALDRALATAKLRYHARWLLYLGAPEFEPAPKVSIVVPIYNRGWLVDSLIKNCLEQRYSPIEIVVVDDGSTDDTSVRLAAFADRIKLICQPNGGVGAARNAGMLAATGEFVQFLDSDNLIDAKHIEEKMRAFAAIADADLCYCKPTEVSLFGVTPPLRAGQAYHFSDGDVLPTIDLLNSIMADGYPFLVSAVTLPRHVFHQQGGFETDLRRAEDARYWFRLALAGVKVIGLASRLFYRCRMMDGVNETRGANDAVPGLVCMRDVVDLLRRPELWPLVAEYLAGYGARKWRDLLDSEASIYGRDFDLLLEAVADLPRAGRSNNRSPLPLLLFLWMLGNRGRALEMAIEPASGRERLAETLLAAIGRAAPLGQPDQKEWLSRQTRPRAKRLFAEILSVRALPELPDEGQAKIAGAIAFLRSIARVASDGETGADVRRSRKKKRKKKRAEATIVVPILADPSTAERTIVSCLGQTIVGRIEIVLVEKETTRTALWSERYPRARVISSPKADSVVEAHYAGLAAAQSKRIRFLLPGDILEPEAVERQIEASQEFDDNVAVVEINGGRPRGLRDAVRRLTLPHNRSMQPTFSAILFPLSVLVKVGGFDLALGDEYQGRYLFRLMAAGVSREFIEGRSALLCRKPLTGSADQIVITALANLVQCLGNPQLWQHIPAVTRPLSAMDTSAVQNSELYSLKIRALDFTVKTISELSSHASRLSPLVPLALCLIGLEWRIPRARQRAPQLDMLRAAILKGTTDMPLDGSSELSISHVLAEMDGDPALAKAVAGILVALDGQPQYAGLQDLLRYIQLFIPDRSRWRWWRFPVTGLF